MLRDLIEQQKAIRDGINQKLELQTGQNQMTFNVDQKELVVILNYWKGFRDQFKRFQEQIERGDYKGIDKWCDALIKGEQSVMNMDKDILEEMKDPYVEETHRRLATVAADTAKWFWGGIKKGFRGIKGIFKTVPKAEEDPNA